MLNPVCSFFRVSLVAALISSASAQLSDQEVEDSYFLEYLPSTPVDPATSMVCGDLDGDLLPDLAFLTGDTLRVMLAPGVLEVLMTAPSDVDVWDVVTVPNASGHDDMLVAGVNGLERLEWDEDILGWNATPLSNLWSDVEELRSFRRPNGEFHLLGLTSNGADVRRAVLSGGNFSETLIELPYVVDDIALVQWNGVGLPEFAEVSGGTLRVRSLANPGVILASQTYATFSNGILEPVGHQGTSQQWLAWVATANGSTTQFFAMFGPGGAFDQQMFLGTPGVHDLVATDYDGDGLQDLMMGCTSRFDIGLVINEGGSAPDFDINQGSASDTDDIIGPAEYLVTTETLPVGISLATPAAADFDGDGDTDAAIANRDTFEIWIGKDARVVSQSEWIPEYVVTPASLPNGEHDTVGAKLDASGMIPDGQGSAAGPMKVSIDLEHPIHQPDAATHVQILAWPLDAFTGDPGIGRSPIHDEIVPLAAPSSPLPVSIVFDTETSDGDLIGMDEMVVVLYRQVAIDSNGVIVAKYPGEITAIEAYRDVEDSSNTYATILQMEFQLHTEFFDVEGTKAARGVLGGGDDDGSGGSGGPAPCSNNSPPFPR